MNLTLVVPEFKILARYQLDGKILLLPIRGRGSASGRTDVLLAKNVKGVGYFPLETVNRGGVR
jgi:predicted aconitase with swiveling domain